MKKRAKRAVKKVKRAVKRKKPKTYIKVSRTPMAALRAKNFLPAYMAMERPSTGHLFFSRGLADFLLGLLVGILVGMVISIYL